MADKNRRPSWQRHVVLVAPEVHWNTGNIGRTCLGARACLHLIKPLGFSLDSKYIRRAGLDYWNKVKIFVWENFDHFLEKTAPGKEEVAVFSKSAKQPYWNMPSPEKLYLIFGSETKGLSGDILGKFKNRAFHIPISSEIRCLNLSTAVGIALYESIRSFRPENMWTAG